MSGLEDSIPGIRSQILVPNPSGGAKPLCVSLSLIAVETDEGTESTQSGKHDEQEEEREQDGRYKCGKCKPVIIDFAMKLTAARCCYSQLQCCYLKKNGNSTPPPELHQQI